MDHIIIFDRRFNALFRSNDGCVLISDTKELLKEVKKVKYELKGEKVSDKLGLSEFSICFKRRLFLFAKSIEFSRRY